jgi:glycosyltransferase involved in cell wall biosynthesis
MTFNRARSSGRPLVSIGLPVFNGANYLRQAIATILDQTYTDLELIISDNASTDDTPRICEEAARKDARVRYSRLPANVGAAANYNRVFEQARGAYFKWAAHDDVLAPTFVERAVDLLESQPLVVLCSSRTGRIDANGKITGLYPSEYAWNDQSPVARFRNLVFSPHACVIVFGLIRRDVLARTPLIGPYVNSDRVLLAELGLAGRICEVPEDLFFRRDHSGSSLRSYPDPRARVVWFDPTKSASFAFPEWMSLINYFSAVARAGLPAAERFQSYLVLLEWATRRWRPLLADFKYAAMGLSARRST